MVVRLVLSLAAGLFLVASALRALPLAAETAAGGHPVSRHEEARRFLRKRGLLGQNGADQLALARRKYAAGAHAAIAESVTATSLLNQPWQSLGPAQVSTTAYGLVTGRVTSIAADPSDATGNTVYLGTTGGGVWRSTNAAGAAGSTAFVPLTDDLPVFTHGAIASLSIGAVSVQPGGTGVILAGTGDPNDALDSYYGTGLLRSGDGGVTWSLISASSDFTVNSFSNLYFTGLAFAGFAWSTQSPNLVVAAVSQSAKGELVGAANLTPHVAAPLSVMGLYYSTDAGQTWLLATIRDGPGQVVQTSVVLPSGGNAATAVAWNPIRKRFYAAVRYHGYYESSDGITWTRLASQPGSALTTTACPTHPNGRGSEGCPIFRGALAVQPVTGDLFALTVDDQLNDQGLWQDQCSASASACVSNSVTFGKRISSTALEDGFGAIPAGDYSLTLASVPSAGDTLLFVGTQEIFRCSLAAGCAFRNTTNTATCAAAQVAPFQHAFDATFAGSLSLMYFGNDSGLWRSTDDVSQTQQPCLADDANHFQNLNGGLGSLSEVQQIAEDPANSAIVLAGMGINGDTAETTAGQSIWPQVLDGYGSYVAVDPANPQNWYAQSASGVGIDLCAEGSSCDPALFGTPVIGFAQVGPDAYAFAEPAPFLLDPQNSANVIAGTCHVWRGPADGLSWSKANLLGPLYAGEGPDCDGSELIQSLAASGTVSSPGGNTELIYAGMAGTGLVGYQPFAGHLFVGVVSDAKPIPGSWTDLWFSPVSNQANGGANGFNPQQFSISSVVVDAHDATGQTVYVTVSGFNSTIATTEIVYMTTDGGASWINISSNLPEAPANSIAVDPSDANTVYVALDTGVYVTTAVSTCTTENCWSVYGTGLPNSPVVQLAISHVGGQSLLRAATYGRGIWQIPLVTAAAAVTTISVSPASLSFAAQQLQTQSTAQTVTVTNTGTVAMVVKQISVSGDFAVVNGCANSVAAGGSCAIQVTFTPTATGTRSATLTIYANIAGGQVSVPLAGTGIAGGAIVLLPTSISFGSSPIGVATTPAQNITISNTGGVAVNLQTPTATGDFAIVANTCSASLAPNFGCTVALAFTPTVSGQRAGVFSITDDVGTQTATLSGMGVAPATDTISPTALTFSPQLVGTASGGQKVMLTNSGDAPLVLISASVAGDFQAVNGCGNSLAGHASCSFTVTFVPERVGAETGSLTINDVYGRPQTVVLNGSGVAPAGISALPTTINFGPWGVSGTSPAQQVTVTNSGGVALGAFTLAFSGDFAMTSGGTCPISPSANTLAPGASCSIPVVFSPAQSGPRTGTMTITGAAPSPSFQVALSGNGFGFAIAVQGASSVTIAAGQTASYMLQITPAAGSAGPVTLGCGAVPQNSVCAVNPASVQLVSGITTSAAVTITTVTSASSGENSRSDIPAALAACIFPAGLLLFRAGRRRRRMLLLVVFLLLPVGCGVTSTGGSSGPSTGGGSGTPVASTYNPIVTATGPGITQSVQLTLIVD